MKIIKGIIKPLLITSALFILSGCSTTSQTTSFDFTKLSCGITFVKHFKYDEVEVLKFRSHQNKSILLMGSVKGMENCESYPCSTCKFYICKDPRFQDIKYYNESENKIYSMSGKKTNNKNNNYVDKWTHKDIVKGSNADYVFNITHRDGFEYEQVFNINNGYLVYEIATPIKVSNNLYISTCDVEALDVYNDFYTESKIKWEPIGSFLFHWQKNF